IPASFVERGQDGDLLLVWIWGLVTPAAVVRGSSDRRLGLGFGVAHVIRKVPREDSIAVADDTGMLDRCHQFSDVPRPVVLQERLECLLREATDPPNGILNRLVPATECSGCECRDVLGSSPEVGQTDL